MTETIEMEELARAQEEELLVGRKEKAKLDDLDDPSIKLDELKPSNARRRREADIEAGSADDEEEKDDMAIMKASQVNINRVNLQTPKILFTKRLNRKRITTYRAEMLLH